MKKILLFSVITSFSFTSYAQDGMRIGSTSAPLEVLHVEGAIKIGSDFNGNTGAPLGGKGTIRWNDTDSRFEGWDGSTWVLLSSAGTDDQDLGTATLSGASLLSIAIETGTGTSVSLAALEESADITTVANDLSTHISADGDLSSTNEIQDLSVASNILTLSGDATTVSLVPYLDNTDNQTAAEVAVTPAGNLGSTDVQAALQELQTDIDGIAPTIEDVLTNGDVAADGQNLEIDKVRARDADGLSLTDDGNEGIFIEDGGNIGIGTTVPDYLLDVQGEGIPAPSTTDNILGRFEQSLTARGAGIQIKGTRNSSGNVASFIDLMNYSSPSDYIVSRMAAERGAGEAGSLLFSTNTGSGITEKMRINSAGVVQLNAYTTNGIVRATGGNGTLAVGALATSDIPAGSVTANNGLTVNTGNNVQLGGTLSADTDVALGGNDFTFSGTGNVGIGTPSPLLKLRVEGDIESSNQIRATGWITGTGTGHGAEVGVSGGYSYFFGYDRTNSTYEPTRLVGSTIELRFIYRCIRKCRSWAR